jgi:TIR domain
MLPPVLEIYIVWHPGDAAGERITETLLAHFRGTAFSGLIGGAIDVYVRTVSPSGSAGDAPPPIPALDPPAYDLAAARHTAVVVVGGTELAAAVETEGPWRSYIEAILDARRADPDKVGVFPVKVTPLAFDKTHLGAVVADPQQIAVDTWGTDLFDETLCRDLAQGIAQMVDPAHQRLKVFISHTKRYVEDEKSVVRRLVDLVRAVIGETRLADFFDAADLQPGEDWAPKLVEEAAHSALLAVRTDLYSSRPWCQREVVTAKRHGMPVVVLDGLTIGEERGSFLMDHVPRIPGHRKRKKAWSDAAIRAALNHLVDECLKRALWNTQHQIAQGLITVDIDWWAPHAPEPATFAEWLDKAVDRTKKASETIIVLHPDPPLGEDERDVLVQIGRLAGLTGSFEFLTPRGLAIHGV